MRPRGLLLPRAGARVRRPARATPSRGGTNLAAPRIPADERCILCGAAGRSHLTVVAERAAGVPDRGWSIAHCARCGLYWLRPRPTADDFAALYGSGYYTHAPIAGPPPQPTPLAVAYLRSRYGYRDLRPGAAARIARWLGPLAESAAAEVRFLAARPGGRLLDVGCGNGEYLALMQALGWEVVGVEPDARAVASARPALQGALHVGTAESVELQPDSFDAVTLHHVIEHLPDPVATLRRCAALLRPGGRLIVLTPNADALGRRVFGRHWLHWDPPRHTFVFTARSLAAVARRAGLHVVAQRSLAHGARWTWHESRRLRAGSASPAGARPASARSRSRSSSTPRSRSAAGARSSR